MKINLTHIFRDPVNLSFKAKLLSALACLTAIFLVAWMTHSMFLMSAYPVLVASMGASAIILFFIPSSPLAQPWPVVAGQVVSAACGMFSALLVADVIAASALAIGTSVTAMLLCRCLHPPGAATALTPVLAGLPITSMGYTFLLVPVLTNTLLLVSLAILINRVLLKRNYPSPIPAPANLAFKPPLKSMHKVGISNAEAEQAMKEMDIFVDLTPSALSRLLNHIESNTFKAKIGPVTCGDIMVENIPVLEYATEVQDAWAFMYRYKHRALPVLDRRSQVIGIVTWSDFFKFVDLELLHGIKDKFHHFIRRTAKLNTQKPEAVGLIMTSDVTVIQESAHIAELIPLMSKQGHRQIPVVDQQQCLVGMVFQEHLIASLYHSQGVQHP